MMLKDLLWPYLSSTVIRITDQITEDVHYQGTISAFRGAGHKALMEGDIMMVRIDNSVLEVTLWDEPHE